MSKIKFDFDKEELNIKIPFSEVNEYKFLEYAYEELGDIILNIREHILVKDFHRFQKIKNE